MSAYTINDSHSVAVEKTSEFQSRPVKKEDARTRILKTALTEFARRGYDGVSTTEIAKAAGVTQPLIHYHFKSKDALWKATVEQIFTWLKEDFMNVSLRMCNSLSDENPKQIFKVVFSNFVDFSRKHPEFGQLLLREGTQKSERLEWLINEWMRPSIEFFVDKQQKGVQEGWLKEIEGPEIINIIASACTCFFSLSPMIEVLYGVETVDDSVVEKYTNTLADMASEYIFSNNPVKTTVPTESVTKESVEEVA